MSDLSMGSFRGVPFRVETEEAKGGRRAVVHVYPQRDKVTVEDMGMAPRRLAVTALIGGKLWAETQAARDKLLAALEAGGSADLVLPGWPTMQVAVEGEVSCSSDHQQRGLYRISFAVVRDDGLSSPTATVSTRQATLGAADMLDSASADDFASRFSVASVPDFVAAGALSDLGLGLDDIAGAVGGSLLSGGVDALSAVRGNLSGLISTPLSLASGILALFRLFGGFGDGQGGRTGGSLGGLGILAGRVTSPLDVPVVTASRRRQSTNRTAINDLIQRGALAQTGRVIAETDWSSRGDAREVRVAWANRVDAAQAATDDPAVFAALTDLRIAGVRDISTRTNDSSGLVTVTPPEPIPAAVLAYDRYDDADREGDILARNGVAHPLFIPPVPLTLRSR
ncbi:DNA circularization protein [Magnetospirillum molischianum]|uniref:Putative DNA circulation-like n=1 Tax=Magnetospirillum molischianum DSM 120 TaxID=1150626 RepID=H8FV01_MAGML|nr:DNA circularization N-terminal domain-containing protein [Magnetospirillum molischianum]CCG42189.1 putative DNA circulation-like [Magnetospirillum molischianum DSM 120]